jgi:hypothetical protein
MHQTCIGKVSFGEKSSVFSPAANDLNAAYLTQQSPS